MGKTIHAILGESLLQDMEEKGCAMRLLNCRAFSSGGPAWRQPSGRKMETASHERGNGGSASVPLRQKRQR